MFVHHVFFWLKESLTIFEKAKFKESLTSLTTIEALKFAHLGVPANTNRDVIDTSYSFSLLLHFENAKDEAIYQSHPTHLKFVEDCSPFWDKVVVYDSIDA